MVFLVRPQCSRLKPRWLQFFSENAAVDYYRCDGCGTVFRVPKATPDGPIRQIQQITIVVPPCSSCQQLAGRHLEATSRGALANFFRCDACGHVWAVPKTPPPMPSETTTHQDERPAVAEGSKPGGDGAR